MKYAQAYDGDWIEPKDLNNHREKCCDCGLVHDYKFRIVKGRIQYQVVRNNRATAAARRKFRNVVKGQ